MTPTSGETPRLEIRGLRKYFAASGVLAVDDVSLEVRAPFLDRDLTDFAARLPASLMHTPDPGHGRVGAAVHRESVGVRFARVVAIQIEPSVRVEGDANLARVRVGNRAEESRVSLAPVLVHVFRRVERDACSEPRYEQHPEQ